MSRKYRIIIGAVGAILLLIVALPFLIPAESFRGPIEGAASRATGRAVQIAGDMSFSVYPEIGITAGQISVANAPGARDPQMITIEEMVVGARFWPLLSGQLEVTRLHLVNPVIHLEIAANGNNNWDSFSQPREAAAGQEESSLTQLGVRDVRITGGQVTYRDASAGTDVALSDVSLAFDLPGLDMPISAEGAVTYNGEGLNLKVSVDSITALLGEEGSATKLAITSPLMNAGFDGKLSIAGDSSGMLQFSAPSLRRVAAWAGHPLGDDENFAAVQIDGTVVRSADKVSFEHAVVVLDGMRIAGDLAFDGSGDIPSLTGAIGIDQLDLNKYLAEDSAAPAAAAGEPSNVPLKFDLLSAANADLTLRAGKIVAKNLTFDTTAMTLSLRDSLLTANLSDATLYGGKGTGKVVIDARKPVAEFSNTLRFANVQMQPLLRDFMGVDRVVGDGGLELDLKASGATEQAIFASLSGRANISVNNGAIRGVNLAEVPRIVQNLITTARSGVIGDDAQTRFSGLNTAFTIRNGVARTNNFLLEAQGIQVRGEGEVSLVNRTLDFHFETKGGGAAIPGTRVALPTIGVPFQVHGPWSKLSYGPDVGRLATGLVEGLARTPGRVIENPLDTLQSLFGGGR